MKIENIVNISVDPYSGDTNDRGYDFSLLNAVSTCPFYGILRHIHSKVFDNTTRNLALECGSLCHECFACYRALSIYYRGINENKTTLQQIGLNYLINLFTKLTENSMEYEVVVNELTNLFKEAETKATYLSKYTIFSDWIIDNSGYYEDPEDKKRTIENIKTSLLSYCSNFLELIMKEPVWIENENNINSKVGIEIPYNAEVKINYIANGYENEQKFHFIGKLDGLHVREDGSLIIHENKTASRLDDSWAGQWYKSHQITGYCLAGSYFTGLDCKQARVLGMQIPVPKYSGYAFRTERVDRNVSDFEDWARWVISTIQVIEEYKDNPEIAPMNTHACCKYYKQCAFVPICTENSEERVRIMNEEMVDQPWSPLDE